MNIEIVVFLLLLCAALLLVAGLLVLRRLRIVAGAGLLGTALLMLASALVLGGFAANLYTYQRLTHEQEVAHIDFRSLGPQHFLARLRLTDGRSLDKEILGDQWQLDARILKWRPPAALTGMNTVFRLERLSGRYHDPEQARNGPYSVHSLAADSGLNLWETARSLSEWLPWVDAVYGSASYLPMADQARYVVTVSSSGLVARAENEAAKRSVRTWE